MKRCIDERGQAEEIQSRLPSLYTYSTVYIAAVSQNDEQMVKHRRTIRKVMRLREGCAKNKNETIMEQEGVRVCQKAVRNNKDDRVGQRAMRGSVP